MAAPTHAMIYTGGSATTMSAAGPLQFLGPLRAFDGVQNWYLLFYPLPEGKTFEEVRHQVTEQYIQAAGSADAMTVEIRKLGGGEWGAKWVRYTVGHEHVGEQRLDVAIPLPNGNQMISRAEVFDAEEAGTLFMAYQRAGDVPPGYALRPVEGYAPNGDVIDLRALTS